MPAPHKIRHDLVAHVMLSQSGLAFQVPEGLTGHEPQRALCLLKLRELRGHSLAAAFSFGLSVDKTVAFGARSLPHASRVFCIRTFSEHRLLTQFQDSRGVSFAVHVCSPFSSSRHVFNHVAQMRQNKVLRFRSVHVSVFFFLSGAGRPFLKCKGRRT